MEVGQVKWCGGSVIVAGGDTIDVLNGKSLVGERTVKTSASGGQEEGNVLTSVAVIPGGAEVVGLRDGGSATRWSVATGKISGEDKVAPDDSMITSGLLGKRTVAACNALLAEQGQDSSPHKAGDIVYFLVETPPSSPAVLKLLNPRTHTLTTVWADSPAETEYHQNAPPSATYLQTSTPEPHTVAIGFSNKTVKVIQLTSAASASAPVSLPPARSAITALAVHPFSPPKVSVGDSNGRIRTWYVSTQDDCPDSQKTTLKEVHWHAHAVSFLAWAPDGTTLASGGDEAVLCLWNAHNWTANRIPRLAGPILTGDWKSDGSKLALGCAPGGIVVLDVASRKPTAVTHGADLLLGQPCDHIVAGPGSTAALVGMQNAIRLYNPHERRYIRTIRAAAANNLSRIDSAPLPKLTVANVAFSANGEHLISVEDTDQAISTVRLVASGEGSSRRGKGKACSTTLRFWNKAELRTRSASTMEDWEEEQRIRRENPSGMEYRVNTFVTDPHEDEPVAAIAVHPRRLLVVTVSAGGEVKRWNFAQDHWVHAGTVRLQGAEARSACFTPDGTVVLVTVDAGVRCVATASLTEIAHLTQHLTNECLRSVLLLSDATDESQASIISHTASHLFCWDLTGQQLLYSLELPVEAIAPVGDASPTDFLLSTSTGAVLRFSNTQPTPVAVLPKIAGGEGETMANMLVSGSDAATATVLYVNQHGRFRYLERRESTKLLAADPAAAGA
eukprot:gene19452-29977_t